MRFSRYILLLTAEQSRHIRSLLLISNHCSVIVLYIFNGRWPVIFKRIWHPPAFPRRLQRSIIGRPGLNHRVRDGYGCFPRAHRHQKFLFSNVQWTLITER